MHNDVQALVQPLLNQGCMLIPILPSESACQLEVDLVELGEDTLTFVARCQISPIFYSMECCELPPLPEPKDETDPIEVALIAEQTRWWHTIYDTWQPMENTPLTLTFFIPLHGILLTVTQLIPHEWDAAFHSAEERYDQKVMLLEERIETHIRERQISQRDLQQTEEAEQREQKNIELAQRVAMTPAFRRARNETQRRLIVRDILRDEEPYSRNHPEGYSLSEVIERARLALG